MDLSKMRKAGILAAKTLEEVEKHIKAGMSTEDINTICHNFIISNNANPGSLNYYGFPKSVCTSINNVICHGIPSKEDILKEGDILKVDVVVEKDGYYGDTCRCFIIGDIDDKKKHLINTTYEAMWQAISICKSGIKINKIGETIENYIKQNGNYGIVRDYCGHGIGKKMHLPPNVLHFNNKENNYILKENTCITIEPMINEGDFSLYVTEDNWTVKTKDNSYSCQWEHTIYIKQNGCEVLTFNNYDKKKKKSLMII
ncbi:type I methionyl aminopeptidase [Rickettsiales bacterium (ex Bugula neritina AB1)]|nr:type I methionyl aminopeptidase [Rickettsiales bacterium (ex Bugula neritina AB1)]